MEDIRDTRMSTRTYLLFAAYIIGSCMYMKGFNIVVIVLTQVCNFVLLYFFRKVYLYLKYYMTID